MVYFLYIFGFVNVILIVFVIFLFMKIKKIINRQQLEIIEKKEKTEIKASYLKTASKTVDELVTKNIELEKKIKKFERKYVGLILKWEPSREDKAAYLLKIHNDSPEEIFNILVEVDPKYIHYIGLFCKKDNCESEKSLNIFFIPGGWSNVENEETNRESFIQVWVQNNLEPIKFTVKYTKTPLTNDFLTSEIVFTADQISKHLDRKISSYKRSKLSIISE